jgi:hypothetical protein
MIFNTASKTNTATNMSSRSFNDVVHLPHINTQSQHTLRNKASPSINQHHGFGPPHAHHTRMHTLVV